MIVQTLLCGFILFAAAFASDVEGEPNVEDVEENTPKFFDLENALKKFVEIFEKVYNVQVQWTDMHSNHTEMKNLFQTKRFQVKVERGPIKIGEVTTSSSTRTLLYANLYDNKANASQTYTVTHTSIRKEKSSYTVTLGFSLGTELSGGFTFKKIYGLSASVGFKFNKETGTTDTQTKLKSFSVATGVTVRPNRTVQVEWYAKTTKKEFIWTCNITISGYFAIGLKKPLENTMVLIIPVWYLALVNRQMEVVGPRHVRFEASGVFTRITVPESEIYTTDVTDTLTDKITTISGRSRIVR
uniref:Putative cytotoxin-like protein n=1 Tax=Ixodes ricinus TaxID=34613 RepID=A0A0K8RK70_IXORI